MATVKFTSVPPKTLYQAILSSASTFKLADIEGWDGADLTSADFGTQAFGAFMSADRTILELFEWDPSTIASASITILYRGLKFDGTQTTEVAGNKRDWAAGTTVMIGSDIPQLLELLADIISDQTIGGVKTFSSIPLTTGGNATTDNQLVRYAQALAMLTGSATVSKIVGAGTAGETVAAGQLVYLKASDGRWWLADADTAATVENINLGIAQGAGTAGNAVTNGVLTYGLDANQTGLTSNTVYYASNTAGSISTTPGTTEVTVGYALSTTTIFFNPRFNQQITEDQQDALAGTSGTPSSTNKYVTNDDTATAATADKIARRLAGGNITVVTETAGTSSTNAASTAFVGTAIAANTQIQQQLNLITGTDTNYATNFSVTMNTAGTILVVSCLLSTQFVKTFRFARDTTTGLFIMTAAGSFTTVTGTLSNGCVMIAGSYVYAAYVDNGVSKLTRFDLADLANSTAMTYSGTAPTTMVAGHSDGTDLYIYTATTNFYRYTISGTTATNAATISYTGLTDPSFGSTSDGTSVWISNATAAGAVTILKYPLAGGASTGSATYRFNYDIYPNYSTIKFFNYKSGVLGIAQANTIASAAAVTGTEVRILGITTP